RVRHGHRSVRRLYRSDVVAGGACRARRVGSAQRRHPAFAGADAHAHGMRGRVSAVHSLFTGTSNQLGEFESGLLGALFGPIPAVLIGGVGTIVVAALWMIRFPELRRFDLADS